MIEYIVVTDGMTVDFELVDVKPTGQITFLIDNLASCYVARSIDQDIHIMNKNSLLDNLDQLLELAND